MNLFDTLKKDAKSINKIIGTIAFSETEFSFYYDGKPSKLTPDSFVIAEDLDIACDVTFDFDESGAVTDTCLTSREKLALQRIFPEIDIPPTHQKTVEIVLKTINDLIELRSKIELQELNEVTETYTKRLKEGQYKGLEDEKIIVGKELVFFYDHNGHCVNTLRREYINPLHFTKIETI